MAPEDIEKMAVIMPIGLFEYLFMTFGLRNSGQTFQYTDINQALGDLDFVFIYVDCICFHGGEFISYPRSASETQRFPSPP